MKFDEWWATVDRASWFNQDESSKARARSIWHAATESMPMREALMHAQEALRKAMQGNLDFDEAMRAYNACGAARLER